MEMVTISSSAGHMAKPTLEPLVALPQWHSCPSAPGSGIGSLCYKLTNSPSDYPKFFTVEGWDRT